MTPKTSTSTDAGSDQRVPTGATRKSVRVSLERRHPPAAEDQDAEEHERRRDREGREQMQGEHPVVEIHGADTVEHRPVRCAATVDWFG